MSSVDDMVSSLHDMRSEQHFHKLLQEAVDITSVILDISIIKPRTASPSVYWNAAVAESNRCEDYYRINVFYTALDAVTQDVALRFGKKQRDIPHLYKVVPSFLISKENDKQWNDIERVFTFPCDHYPCFGNQYICTYQYMVLSSYTFARDKL